MYFTITTTSNWIQYFSFEKDKSGNNSTQSDKNYHATQWQNLFHDFSDFFMEKEKICEELGNICNLHINYIWHMEIFENHCLAEPCRLQIIEYQGIQDSDNRNLVPCS